MKTVRAILILSITTILFAFGTVPITPFGTNPDWDSPVTTSGVWGESFTDLNNYGRWDSCENLVDDDRNSMLDHASSKKYDGISQLPHLSGMGS